MKGRVEAVVARMDEPNGNGLILAPGALQSGRVCLISSVEHAVLRGAPAVGMGVLHLDGADVVLRGRYDLDTPAGRNAYAALQLFGDRVQWSVGVYVLEEIPETRGGILYRRALRVVAGEVSPVGEPAEPRTYTRALDGRALPGAMLRAA